MKTIFTVLKKELKITLRDKKTLFTVLLLPAIIFPVIILMVSTIQKKVSASENEKEKIIAITNLSDEYKTQLFSNEKFKVLENYTKEAAEIALKNESIDAFVEFNLEFGKNIEALKHENVSILYKSTNSTIFSDIKKQIEALNQTILTKRITNLGLSQEFLRPIEIKEINIASEKEKISELIGGFLPYILVIFCFVGCMYPAIELTTGEKEKKTMETLLTAPVSRFHILLGKVLTMTLIGITSSVIILLSISINISFISDIPLAISNTIKDILSLKFILMLLGMLIPLAFFFSSIISAFAIKANNFKEAQSTIQPLMFCMFVPIIIGLIPGITLDMTTVWIPILNLSLATKQIIADTINPLLYFIIIAANFLISIAAIYFSSKQFSKDSLVLS